MTNAAVDIMYIDLQRRWDHMNPERTSGNDHPAIKSAKDKDHLDSLPLLDCLHASLAHLI